MSQQHTNIKTAENIFTMIEKIEELDQPTCSELSEHVDLSVSSVYNYLNTLVDSGYIVESDGRYRLSLKFLQKGRSIRNSYPIMHAAVEPVDILAKSIDEYISVFVKEERSVVMIYEGNSHHAVHVPGPFLGEPFHLAKSPQGKVVLAHTSESLRRDILDRSDLEEEAIRRVEDQIEVIRNEGILVDAGETHDNIWGVAAPVEVDDEIYGSLLISTVLHRLDDQRAQQELPALLRQTAKEVEHRLSRYDFDDLYLE